MLLTHQEKTMMLMVTRETGGHQHLKQSSITGQNALKICIPPTLARYLSFFT